MVKLLVSTLILPQLLIFGLIGRIQKALEKKEYEKAYELVLKGLDKEPNNPGLSYYHGLILFTPSFSRYDIDRALVAIKKAKEDFDHASTELREELIADGVTPQMLNVLHARIRDKAYENTLQHLSVDRIEDFKHKFPLSIYDDILTYKADSLDFLQVLSIHTEDAYSDYIATHPSAVFSLKADSILDDIRVALLRKSGTLHDYYNFLKQYPQTRHRKTLERYILQVSTASHQPADYLSFLRYGLDPELKKQAADILYYLMDQQPFSEHPLRDSLVQVRQLSTIELFAVVDRGRFGFHDRSGRLMIDYQFTGVQENIKCQLSEDGWVFVVENTIGHIMTKEGRVLIHDAQDYRSISDDVGLVKIRSVWYLFHKSGFQIYPYPIQDAQVIANLWIKIKREGKWGLITFTGLTLTEPIYDEIYLEGSFWVFKKNGLLAVYTQPLILKEIEERGLSLEFKFDDIEPVNNNMLIGFRGGRECLLDSTLNFLIPWGYYEVYPDESGWYMKSDKGYRLYNQGEQDIINRFYPYLESNKGWFALQTERDWMLLPRDGGLTPSRGYDSIKLITDFACITLKEQQKSLLFISGKTIPIKDENVSAFATNHRFISTSSLQEMIIYDTLGNVAVSGAFEHAMFLNDSLIHVQIRGKQGLIHTGGDWVLNPVFDALDLKDGLVLTLLNGKIGCYDLHNHQLIHADYDGRIERLGDQYLAKKEGQYGVINSNQEPLISFSYDVITQWNDTSYLVQKNADLIIINKEEKPIFFGIQDIRVIAQNDRHAIYQYIKEGRYGVMSNTYGEILPPEFTDILNIGSMEDPLIFADQHLAKAGYHVVSYVSEYGKLVLSRAYTKDEFDMVLCE